MSGNACPHGRLIPAGSKASPYCGEPSCKAGWKAEPLYAHTWEGQREAWEAKQAERAETAERAELDELRGYAQGLEVELSESKARVAELEGAIARAGSLKRLLARYSR